MPFSNTKFWKALFGTRRVCASVKCKKVTFYCSGKCPPDRWAYSKKRSKVDGKSCFCPKCVRTARRWGFERKEERFKYCFGEQL